jgi:hypothetical protein
MVFCRRGGYRDVKRERRPVLITSAERSQDDQMRQRQIRYVLMMSIRAVSLILAAVLVSAHVPLLWLWIPLCLLGMLVVPWLAVILANDRPPKSRHRIAYYLHRERHRPEPPHVSTLPSQPRGYGDGPDDAGSDGAGFGGAGSDGVGFGGDGLGGDEPRRARPPRVIDAED